MAAPKNGSRVNADLDRHLKKLLNDAMKDPVEGDKNAPTLTDRMKIIDRVLKWEMVKAKLQDGGWGTGFDE